MRQSALPGIRKLSLEALRAVGVAGLNLRGCVVKVYAYDYQLAPQDRFPVLAGGPRAVYVDVLVFSTMGSGVIPRALVLQEYAGRNEGTTRLPRACQIPPGVKDLDDLARMDMTQLDGDWVALGFFDNEPALPFVLGYVPHPALDDGLSSGLPVGERLRVSDVGVDGRTHLEKRNGTVVGVDAFGGYQIDLTKAHAGLEPPPTSPPGGALAVRLVGSNAFTITVDGQDCLLVQGSGATAAITVGNGAKALVLAPEMAVLWAALVTAAAAMTPPVTLPPFNAASTLAKVPG